MHVGILFKFSLLVLFLLNYLHENIENIIFYYTIRYNTYIYFNAKVFFLVEHLFIKLFPILL
jgi:hypothetical protein